MKIIKVTQAREYSHFLRLFNSLFREYALSVKNFNKLFLAFFGDKEETHCYIALVDNFPVGLAATTLVAQEKSSYLHFIGVAEEFRRQRIGTALLEKIIKDSDNVYFSGFPKGYLVPGLDGEKYPEGEAFFKAHGFKEINRACSMKRSLSGFKKSDYYDTVAAKEYSIIPFEGCFFSDVMKILSSANHPEWKEAFIKAYYANDSSNLGYIAVVDRVAVGFAGYGIVGDDKERFGPIAVLSEFRKRKIGLNLTVRVMEAQKKIGCKETYFLWGEGGSVALKMYLKLGFKVYSDMAILKYSKK